MNTVDANKWAADIGRSRKPEKKISGPSVADEVTLTLKERAKSASLILGRRQTDYLREALYTEEGVKGVQLRRVQDRIERELDKDNEKTKQSDYKLFKQRSSFKSRITTPLKMRRPLTAAPKYKIIKAGHQSNEPLTFAKGTLKVMSLSGHISKYTNHVEILKHNDNTKSSGSQADSCTHIEYRTKSAPPPFHIASTEPFINNRPNFHLPLFWKTRKSYHRKQNLERQISDTGGNSSGNGTNGTQLRSLLQNNHTSICRQSCPYNCRSCFKACLASDTYIQGQLEMKQLRSKSIETSLSDVTSN